MSRQRGSTVEVSGSAAGGAGPSRASLHQGDPFLIRHAVANLLQNAIDFSPDRGEIRVTLSTTADGRVAVSVRDHGPGITPVDQKRVFEKYARGGEHDKPRGGFGLGLWIVKESAERMGGTVRNCAVAVLDVAEAGEMDGGHQTANYFPPELIAALSRGYHAAEPLGEVLVVVPHFWMTPLINLDRVGPEKKLFLFGARPATMSAIPGEQVPDGLLRTLKALAEPTRLKILRMLYREELGPAELARRLDLRVPTIIHHLKVLRLAGLVNLTIRGQDKRYRARLEAFDDTNADMKRFITTASLEEPEPAHE